jgi:hypothetical protein
MPTCSCGKPSRTHATCHACRTKARDYYTRIRSRALLHYGGRCCQCGYARPAALVILPTRPSLLAYLHQENYPPGYAVYCRNCAVEHTSARVELPENAT